MIILGFGFIDIIIGCHTEGVTTIGNNNTRGGAESFIMIGGFYPVNLGRFEFYLKDVRAVQAGQSVVAVFCWVGRVLEGGGVFCLVLLSFGD